MQLRASLHNTMGGGIRLAIQLLTVPLLIRQIGVSEYGLWALVSAVMGVVALVEGGLTVATTVYVARDRTKQDREGMGQTLTIILGSMILLATVAAGILWVGASNIKGIFNKLDPGQREAAILAVNLSGVVIWTRLLQQVFVGMEQAFHRYGTVNLINTFQQLLANVGMLVVAVLGGRIVAFMQWQILVGFLMLILHAGVAWNLVRTLHLRPHWNWAKAKEIGGFSMVAWFAMLGTALFSQCDRLVVGAVLGPHALGIYAAIVSITTQINGLSGLPVQPLLPQVSQLAMGREESVALRSRVRQAMQMNAVIAFSAGSVLCLFAPVIVRFLLPDWNKEIIFLFRLSTFICAVYSLNASGYFILLGLGRALSCTKVVFLSGLSTLLLIWLGSVWKGLLGAIGGTAGYWATLILLRESMGRLGCTTREWLQWLRWPSIWCLVVFPVNSLMPDVLVWKAVLLVAELGLLGAWWYACHYGLFGFPRNEIV